MARHSFSPSPSPSSTARPPLWWLCRRGSIDSTTATPRCRCQTPSSPTTLCRPIRFFFPQMIFFCSQLIFFGTVFFLSIDFFYKKIRNDLFLKWNFFWNNFFSSQLIFFESFFLFSWENIRNDLFDLDFFHTALDAWEGRPWVMQNSQTPSRIKIYELVVY